MEEDIKAGETYNMRVKVTSVNEYGGEVATIPVDENGKELDDEWAYYGLDIASAFSPITPENGTKNVEPAPKYDPCRLFRKGDKVRVVDKKNGRTPPCCGDIEAGELYTVSDDEDGGDVMLAVNGKYDCIKWYWLELVAPVEELEPYFVMELKGAYGVYNTRFQPETEACHFFTDMHPHAKEAAEAECDRLNAEHRKEQQ